MGIPLDIFSLYSFEGEGCRHYLLLRVGRPEFHNADEGDYGRAEAAAEGKRRELIGVYEAGALARECAAARHAATLAGELQARPAGVESFEAGGGYVEVWVAGTRYGRPWVVFGTAETEEEFWREVRLDEDLSGLGPTAPAERRRAYFLSEEGDGAGG
ncbi:MAG TPA: hypothetical protein VF668_02330 [Pyrinomonadaceae bacterium]|jgi:hypothetical protein